MTNVKQIVLENRGRQLAVTEVADDDWVSDAIDAGWQWLRMYQEHSVTVRDADGLEPKHRLQGPRIATITLELHDE